MKTKFPRETALAAAREICAVLKPVTERLIVAGSLRRRKEQVGDLELVYIPKIVDVDNLEDWFGPKIKRNETDVALECLLSSGLLTKRPNVLGNDSWGPKNKLSLHAPTGVPVDFFSTTEAAWFNYLVCRTGSAETNTRIASAAQAKGWKWHPYSKGFTDEEGNPVTVKAERDVFDLVGLPYLEAWDR